MNMGQFFILIAMLVLFFLGAYFVLTMYEQDEKYKDFFYGFQNEKILGFQFYPNMRYQESQITYNIEPACTDLKIEKIKQALSIIQKKTILTFTENSKEPEINFLCSNIAPKPEEETHFIAGEGGPSEIINASYYSVILSGRVSLFRKEQCDKPQVAIHEILHALGFDHSNNPNSIMYSVTDCNQEIEQELINKINSLYSVESNPDLVIENTKADKENRLLTFEITVSNFGLKESTSANLVVYADEKVVKEFNLNVVGIGVRKMISVENLRLPSKAKRVSFVIETDEAEISKTNNAVELVSEE